MRRGRDWRLIRAGQFRGVDESRDVCELASQAAAALESYRRAPWTQINDQVRVENVERAIALLRRVHDLETGKIPPPICGDV